MNKSDLRRTLRERRRLFVAGLGDRQALEREICSRVLTHLGEAKIAAVYLHVGSEVDPLPLLKSFYYNYLVTCLPHVSECESTMRFLRWSPGDPLLAGPYGLLQPDPHAPEMAPDLIVTPLVGFDRAMRRIGQGAGFYDRAFARLPAARRIGLAWSAQEADALPADPWDVPLHAVATEKEWIEPDA
jgi:5-formyltetrahydrofolate cyclo-ligase